MNCPTCGCTQEKCLKNIETVRIGKSTSTGARSCIWCFGEGTEVTDLINIKLNDEPRMSIDLHCFFELLKQVEKTLELGLGRDYLSLKYGKK